MREATRTTTTSDRLTTVLSYGSLLLMIYLVFEILSPFFVPLAWSAVLAIFFYSMYRPVERRLGKTKAALICTLGVTVLLILPVMIVMVYAAREALDVSARFQVLLGEGSKYVPGEGINWVRGRLPAFLQNTDFLNALRQGAEKVASYLAGSMGGLLKNLFSFFVNLFILLFALFFMFRDGDEILRAVRHLLPFEKDLQDSMVNESGDLIFASVAVALLIAIIQGLLGGIAFAFTGIRAPVFMGVLVAFFSIVPVVGSALIWFPAAGWLAFEGHWGKAFLILAICGGVASLADNIVRPLLLRNRTSLNDLLLFISILGGLDMFGLLGLVAGPTIVAAALGVFRVYTAHRDELEKGAT